MQVKMSLHKLCLNCELRSLRVERDRTFLSKTVLFFQLSWLGWTVVRNQKKTAGKVFSMNHLQKAHDIVHKRNLSRSYCSLNSLYSVFFLKLDDLHNYSCHHILRQASSMTASRPINDKQNSLRHVWLIR